jgi:hypothetical protein
MGFRICSKQRTTIDVKAYESDINFSKWLMMTIYSYPFSSISETLQRIIFIILQLKQC